VTPNLAKYLDTVLIPGGFVQDRYVIIVMRLTYFDWIILIDNRIERLACDIAIDLANEPFVALCVLKGGYQFFSDLLDKIRQLYRYRSSADDINKDVPEGAQQIRVEFIRIKSYEDEKSTGNIKIIGIESLSSLEGKVSNILFLYQ